MLDFFSDLTTLTISKSLDGFGFKHRVIANNIANVETPGFVRSDVTFEEKLREAFESGDRQSVESRIRDTQPDVLLDTASPARPDGNNVSIDKEMAELTKNTLQYEALVQLMNLKSSMVHTAINEGRR